MEPEIMQFLGQYGVLGLLVYIFIKDGFAYLKDKRTADTLKEANAERKEGTDEVAKALDNKQEVCIATMGKDVEFIKLQVSNHIPTAIKELNEKLDTHIKDQNKFETDVLVKIAKI